MDVITWTEVKERDTIETAEFIAWMGIKASSEGLRKKCYLCDAKLPASGNGANCGECMDGWITGDDGNPY